MTVPGMPALSIHSVTRDGAVSVEAANVPYTDLQWTRRMDRPGEWAARLACPLPVRWPGRYIVTLDGHDECGLIEKAQCSEGADGLSVDVSGRFAEALFDRYRFGKGGETVEGGNWRRAATAAMRRWHMGDIPPLRLGDGADGSGGTGFAVTGEEGKSACEAVYRVLYAEGARPVLSYTRGEPGLALGISTGRDLTRGQAVNRPCVIALSTCTASSIEYSGDYSASCSEVACHAEREKQVEKQATDEDGKPTTETDTVTVSVNRTVAVPGFDPDAMWAGRAYEDVSSLIERDADPTAQAVDEAGRLRAHDHMPQVELDADCTLGYPELWDLGDTVEMESPALGMVSTGRVEETREVYSESGASVEATVGTKRVSRLARALAGRR